MTPRISIVGRGYVCGAGCTKKHPRRQMLMGGKQKRQIAFRNRVSRAPSGFVVQPALRDEPGRCEGFGEDQVRCKISRHWSLLSGWVSDWLVQPSMQDEVGRSSGSGGPVCEQWKGREVRRRATKIRGAERCVRQSTWVSFSDAQALQCQMVGMRVSSETCFQIRITLKVKKYWARACERDKKVIEKNERRKREDLR